MDDEAAAERFQGGVDALQVFDDGGAEIDLAQVGDGVGGHGGLLVDDEEASFVPELETITCEVMRMLISVEGGGVQA